MKYRLIVLSRNLTFDRCWDLSAVINGESRGKRKPANRPLIDFFDEVYRGSSTLSFDEVIDPEELIRVHWDNPDNMSKFSFLSTILMMTINDSVQFIWSMVIKPCLLYHLLFEVVVKSVL